jgi:hypothetical protein
MATPSKDPPLYCRDAFELFSVAFERLAAEFAEPLTEVNFALAGRRVRARILGHAVQSTRYFPGRRRHYGDICFLIIRDFREMRMRVSCRLGP